MCRSNHDGCLDRIPKQLLSGQALFIIAFISRYSGPSNHTPAAAWVILVVGVATLVLMWLTAVRARE
jgi:hypothetical protein